MSNGNNIVIIGVPSREAGLRAIDRVETAVDEGTITVQDVAMAYKNDKGKVKIHQTSDATAGKSAAWGGALGLLVGVVAAPLVPAVAVGAGIGAIAAKAKDGGISNKLMKQVAEALESNEAVVFVLADESSTLTIGATIEEAIAGGAKIDYGVLPEDAQDFLREAIKLAGAE